MDLREYLTGDPGRTAGVRRTWHQSVYPGGFGDFRLTRSFRGARYYIDVQNPNSVQKGIQKLIVDGKEIEGHIIPFEEGKTEYHVTAVMG